MFFLKRIISRGNFFKFLRERDKKRNFGNFDFGESGVCF